jgi:hypothetical protein
MEAASALLACSHLIAAERRGAVTSFRQVEGNQTPTS